MIKKNLQIAGLGALLALSATAASAADTANANLTLNANAPRTCAVSGDVTATGAATVTGGTGGSGATVPNVSVNFGDRLVDPITALPTFDVRTQIRGAATALHKVELTIPAYCNYANSNISIRSTNGGMRNQATATTDGTFANAISLFSTVSRVTGGVSRLTASPIPHNAANSTNSGSVATPWNGSLQLTLYPAAVHAPSRLIGGSQVAAPDGTPVLAGTYSDTMTVRFGQVF